MTAFRDADAYERGRPGWPDEAVDVLCAALGVGAESTIADLGAGTGKLTRLLVDRAARVVAIEPSASMLGVLRRIVPRAEPVLGTAEALPLADATLQAVFVGEAFHWFGSPEVVDELARVVVPGGGLALLWNRADPWPELRALGALRERRSFPFGDDRWRASIERSAAFGPLAQRSFGHEQRLDRAALVAQVASFSWVQSLDEDERRAVLDAVAAEVPDELVIPFRTTVFWTIRTAG